MFFLESYFNANQGMGISVTKIQTNLHIWTCCNQIQQYSPFIIYAVWLMFNKIADDVPSEPRTTKQQCSFQTTLDVQHLMVFHDLCQYYSAVPQSSSRLRGTVNKVDFMWNCLQFYSILHKNIMNLLKFVLPFQMTGFFWCFCCYIYEIKPDIFEILRTSSRYLEKKSGISGNIFRPFFVIFVSRPKYRVGCRNVSHCQQEQCYSGLRSPGRSKSTYF